MAARIPLIRKGLGRRRRPKAFTVGGKLLVESPREVSAESLRPGRRLVYSVPALSVRLAQALHSD